MASVPLIPKFAFGRAANSFEIRNRDTGARTRGGRSCVEFRGVPSLAARRRARAGVAPARAAARAAGKQAPGYYRYKVGSIEVTVVTDGVNRFKFADDHVANKSRSEVNAALAAAYLEQDFMTTPYNPVVVNTG